VTFSDLYGSSDDGGSTAYCRVVIDTSTNAFLESIRPNTGTSIDDA
jgi:hypothetical protein